MTHVAGPVVETVGAVVAEVDPGGTVRPASDSGAQAGGPAARLVPVWVRDLLVDEEGPGRVESSSGADASRVSPRASCWKWTAAGGRSVVGSTVLGPAVVRSNFGPERNYWRCYSSAWPR